MYLIIKGDVSLPLRNLHRYTFCYSPGSCHQWQYEHSLISWQKCPVGCLNLDIITLSLFYWPIKSQLLGLKWLLKHQDLQMISLKLNTIISNFHSLEVVGRGSETQLQVGENLNKLT